LAAVLNPEKITWGTLSESCTPRLCGIRGDCVGLEVYDDHLYEDEYLACSSGCAAAISCHSAATEEMLAEHKMMVSSFREQVHFSFCNSAVDLAACFNFWFSTCGRLQIVLLIAFD
jgi:hypothetical protein